MPSADMLLYWVSCVAKVSKQRLLANAKRVVNPLPLNKDIHQRTTVIAKKMRTNLLRLGHIDPVGPSHYSIVSPMILRIGSNWLLVGARWPKLIDDILAYGADIEEKAQPHGPSRIMLRNLEKIEQVLSMKLKIEIIENRWLEVMSSLVPLRNLIKESDCEPLPDSYEVWRPTEPKKNRWKPIFNQQMDGLHRSRAKPHKWYWQDPKTKKTYRLDTPEKYVGAAWLQLKNSRKLVFNNHMQILKIPAIGFYLPLLLDRGLILCSGLLPTYENGYWCYQNISRDMSEQVARILSTDLEILK